jgi:ABC-2 type transport system ATP-binding protein
MQRLTPERTLTVDDYRGVVEAAQQPLIEAQGITKRYGAVAALDDVSVTVTVPAVGLLGANGAGKSTLMKTMLGLVKPDAGAVRVMGVDAASQDWDARRRLGYMPEHSCLPMGMTARDLVVHMGELRGLPRRVAVLRASEVLFQVGLEEERSRLIRTFSVGMRQRTNLAQAIVHSPELVILDEPTNGLDPAGRDEMLTLVRRLSAELGIAVVMSSHVLEDVARTCDAVVVLREGKLAASRTIDRERETQSPDLRVRVSGDQDAFVAALAARGVAVQHEEDHMVATGDSRPATLDAIRDAAAESGVGLRELTAAGPTLEDALIGAME